MRSKSTPGLLETEGRTTIQTCIVNHRIIKPQGILRSSIQPAIGNVQYFIYN